MSEDLEALIESGSITIPPTRFSIRHGASIPTANQLNPFELGFCTSNKLLYIKPGENANPISINYLPLSGGTLTGHIYLSGAKENSSTSNTSQIIFGTSGDNHVALSSNRKALVINPSSSTTTNQIVFYLDKASEFPSGINSGGLITAKGGISSTTLITSGKITANGSISTTSLTTSGTITANGGISSTTLTTSGKITASGVITANDGITTTTLTASGVITANDGITTTSVTASKEIAANAGISTTTLTASGAITANGSISTTTLTASGQITASGGITTTTLGATGNITTNGSVTLRAIEFAGNTSHGGYIDFKFQDGTTAVNDFSARIMETSLGVLQYLYKNASGTEYKSRIPRTNFGSVSITPSAANTPTSKAVAFTNTFSAAPRVIVSAETAVPGTYVLGASVNGIGTTQFTAWLTRTDTTKTTIDWVALL
jgi:hypothetical protein